MTTLIIDDSLDNLEALKEYTSTTSGGIIICCTQFDAGVNAIRTDLSITTVFLDVKMPGIRGLEGVARLRAELIAVKNPTAKLIAMSVDKTALKGAVAEGADFTVDTGTVLKGEPSNELAGVLSISDLGKRVENLEASHKRFKTKLSNKWFLASLVTENPFYVTILTIYAISSLEGTIHVLEYFLGILKASKGG